MSINSILKGEKLYYAYKLLIKIKYIIYIIILQLFKVMHRYIGIIILLGIITNNY